MRVIHRMLCSGMRCALHGRKIFSPGIQENVYCQTWDARNQPFVDCLYTIRAVTQFEKGLRHSHSRKPSFVGVRRGMFRFNHSWTMCVGTQYQVNVCGLGYLRRAATFFVDYVRRQAVGSGSSCVDSGTCGGPPLFKLSSKYQAGIFVGLATLQETYGSVLMVGEKEHVFYMSSTTFRYSMMWASPSAGSGWMWHFDGSRHE